MNKKLKKIVIKSSGKCDENDDKRDKYLQSHCTFKIMRLGSYENLLTGVSKREEVTGIGSPYFLRTLMISVHLLRFSLLFCSTNFLKLRNLECMLCFKLLKLEQLLFIVLSFCFDTVQFFFNVVRKEICYHFCIIASYQQHHHILSTIHFQYVSEINLL